MRATTIEHVPINQLTVFKLSLGKPDRLKNCTAALPDTVPGITLLAEAIPNMPSYTCNCSAGGVHSAPAATPAPPSPILLPPPPLLPLPRPSALGEVSAFLSGCGVAAEGKAPCP